MKSDNYKLLLETIALAIATGCSHNSLQWHVVGTIPVFGTAFSSGVYNNDLWYCGGVWPGTPTNENSDCFRNDTMVFNMPVKRAYSKGWVKDGKLFVLGGRENERAVGSFFYIDLSTGKTTELAPMNDARVCFAFGVFENGNVIVVGGTQPNDSGFENNTTLLNTVELYDVTKNEWTFIENFPYAGEEFGAINSNDNLIVFGGLSFSTLKTIPREYHREIYMYKNGWKQIGDMGVDLSGYGVAKVEGDILLIGGHSLSYGYSDRVFRFNGTTLEQEENKLVVGVNDVDPIVVGSDVFVLGGELLDDQHKNKTNLIQKGVY